MTKAGMGWRGWRVGLIVCLLGATSIATSGARAAEPVEFSAQADRTQLSVDDSLAIRFTFRAAESISIDEPPKFDSSNFEVINQYSSSQFQTSIINGQISATRVFQITEILKPLKLGNFKIANIRAKVNGQAVSAPPIDVSITPGGSGTPPPAGYGGAGVGLRGSAKKTSGPGFMIRAEVDKQKLYKGEQLIVSYFHYRRVRTFNISVDKYASLPGFLREDLEMPVLQPRLNYETVVLDGVPWERTLLIRYAAYPLKEGKLIIDSMAIRSNYFPAANQGGGAGGGGGEEEDPFFGFFQQTQPQVGASTSEPVTVEVMPLPTEGRPASFSGGVGEFSLQGSVDKTQVKVGEAITLTVKVQGRGNLASVEIPKAQWPDGVELYDSKGRAKASHSGIGQKDFEFLLIPRRAGPLTLPALEFSYFDPSKKAYVVLSTQPTPVLVLAGDGSVAPVAANPAATPASGGKAEALGEIRGMHPPGETVEGIYGLPFWRWLYWLSGVGLLVFATIVGIERMRRRQVQAETGGEARRLAEAKSWQSMRQAADSARTGTELVHAYELLSGAIYDAVDRAYAVGARSLPRSTLRRILVEEKSLAEATWDRISRLLEFAEMVRFATAAGAVSEGQAKEQLSQWISEGQAVEHLLGQGQASGPVLK